MQKAFINLSTISVELQHSACCQVAKSCWQSSQKLKVNKVINHLITSFNKVVKSVVKLSAFTQQAVNKLSSSCQQTIIKLSATLLKQRITMFFNFNVPSFLSKIMLQRMASCTQTDELGERKEQQSQKMLECLVFIGTFSPRLQGSRLELKTRKPLMDNLWWNPDEGSKEGALCALSLIVDVWLCGPRFWTKTPPAKSGRGWIWQLGGRGGCWLPFL